MRKEIAARAFLTFTGFLFILTLLGCGGEFHYFRSVGGSRRLDLDELFGLLEKYKSPEKAKERFIINKQIMDFFNQNELERRKNCYLTYIVELFPDDPYNGYYLADVARTHERLGAPQFARHYYEKVVSAYEDLYYGEEYLHRYCLQRLAALSLRPEEKILFYGELLKRFASSIDSGAASFSLARAYEEVGEYARALEMYKEFLRAPPTTVPGFPDASARVKEKVYLFENKPAWIHHDLNRLVSLIRDAVAAQDEAALTACLAQGYFFTLTWEQKNDESLNIFTEASMIDYIGSFLRHSQVVVEDKLDVDSSDREAFLRTDKWAFQIHPTWYLYFRKVDFPADPEIHGGWEWAGIYFGEKL